MAAEEERRSWSNPPVDILSNISKRLSSKLYLTRFRSVCKTWRSCTPIHPDLVFPGDHPLLMMFQKKKNCPAMSHGCFSKNHIFLLSPPPLPDQHQEDHRRRPWLIKVGQDHLWHPLLRNESLGILPLPLLDFIQLPALDLGLELRFNSYRYSEKVTAALWQEEEQFLHVVDRGLSLTEPTNFSYLFCGSNSSWTIFFHGPTKTICSDICVFKGRPYVLEVSGRTIMLGSDHLVQEVAVAEGVLSTHFGMNDYSRKYLVVSGRDLLLVDKMLSTRGDRERARIFNVYRLNEERKMWVRLSDLGDRVIFLGSDSAFSASASQLCVGRGNCIVFRDDPLPPQDDPTLPRDDGFQVFQCDQRQISPLSTTFPEYSTLFWPPPEWARLP